MSIVAAAFLLLAPPVDSYAMGADGGPPVATREIAHLDWWEGGVCLLAEGYGTTRGELKRLQDNRALLQESVENNALLRLTHLDNFTSGTELLVSVDPLTTTVQEDGGMVTYYSVTVNSIYDKSVTHIFSDERMCITTPPDIPAAHIPQEGYRFHADADGVCLSYNGLSVTEEELGGWLRQDTLSDRLTALLGYSARELTDNSARVEAVVQALDTGAIDGAAAGAEYSALTRFLVTRGDGSQLTLSAHVPISVLAAPPVSDPDTPAPKESRPGVPSPAVPTSQTVAAEPKSVAAVAPAPSAPPAPHPRSSEAVGGETVTTSVPTPTADVIPAETPPLSVPDNVPGGTASTGETRWTEVWRFLKEHIYIAEFGTTGILWAVTMAGLAADLRLLRDYKKRKEANRWSH